MIGLLFAVLCWVNVQRDLVQVYSTNNTSADASVCSAEFHPESQGRQPQRLVPGCFILCYYEQAKRAATFPVQHVDGNTKFVRSFFWITWEQNARASLSSVSEILINRTPFTHLGGVQEFVKDAVLHGWSLTEIFGLDTYRHGGVEQVRRIGSKGSFGVDSQLHPWSGLQKTDFQRFAGNLIRSRTEKKGKGDGNRADQPDDSCVLCPVGGFLGGFHCAPLYTKIVLLCILGMIAPIGIHIGGRRSITHRIYGTYRYWWLWVVLGLGSWLMVCVLGLAF